MLMMDSGACTHVAPLDFAEDVKLEDAPMGLDLTTVSGKSLEVQGMRRVQVWVLSKKGVALPIVVPFIICSVKRAILSVSELSDKGFSVGFDPPEIKRGLDSVAMLRRGAHYFLPVCWDSETCMSVNANSDGEILVESSWDESVRLASGVPIPKLPAEYVIETRNLTHLPFALGVVSVWQAEAMKQRIGAK